MMAIGALQSITALLTEQFGISSAKIDSQSTLESLGLDSLHAVALMLDLEADLGVSLSDVAISRTAKLGDLAALVDARLAGSLQSAA